MLKKNVQKILMTLALACFAASGALASGAQKGEKKSPPPKAPIVVDKAEKKEKPREGEDKKRDGEKKNDERKPPLMSYLRSLVSE